MIRTGDDRVQRSRRLPHHRDARAGHPAQRHADLPARHLAARGGAGPRRPRHDARADAEALLGLAKELGCNFVRLAHYPHNDEMTRAADRLGLLVWSEIPVYWTIAWSNAGTLATARAQLAEEIARDHNRASVILWSVGNETPVSEARNQLPAHAGRRTRAPPTDTRLVTAALEHHAVDARTHVHRRSAGRALDVLGPQRVRRLVRRAARRSATRSPGGPLTTSRSSSASSAPTPRPACTATR